MPEKCVKSDNRFGTGDLHVHTRLKTILTVAAFIFMLLVTASSEDVPAPSKQQHPGTSEMHHKDRSSWSDRLAEASDNTRTSHYLSSPLKGYEDLEEVTIVRKRRHFNGLHAGRLRRSNENEPQFERDEYLSHVDENIPIGSSVLTVRATDQDMNEDGIIIYELRDTNDFSIDSGGVISTENRLDYESTGGTYRFYVVAKNPGENSRGTRVPVILQIRDNEERPHFDSSHYYFDISEFARQGDYVGTVVAMDDDNDLAGYSLTDLIPPDLFEINERNGIITVLNRSNAKRFTYDFKAVAYDEANHTTEVPVTVNIIDENTNKPIFDNCSAYDNYVQKENQSAPAAVFTVTATDSDHGQNGEVKYYLLDGESIPEFSIDEETGELTVEQSLDREEGPKEYILTVIAKDGGDRPLQSSCSFAIIVGDVNDNPPVFDQEKYEQSIPADTQVDVLIIRLTATDADIGPNADIRYTLENSTDASYFKIDSEAGYIYLNRELNSGMANERVFRFEGKASDSGSPPLYSTVDVEISVVTAGDVPPSVAKQIPEEPSVLEDATQDTNIVTICAQSNADTEMVYMDFLNGNIPETNSEGTFNIRLSSDPLAEGCNRGQVAGNIYLDAKNLDFEEIQSYTLTVQLMNERNARADYTLNIQVIDVNDMPPVLHQPYYQSVSENINKTLVLTVVAIDKDLSPQFRQLTYGFNDPPSEVRASFQIDEETGDVWTLHPLDREMINLYRLPIRVSDGVHIRDKQYLIMVNDQNDEPPVINMEEGVYETKVNEDLAVGKDTGIVIAVDDPDILNEFSYQIVDGNSEEKFRIDSKTGTIYVNTELNYDIPVNDRNFTLTVRVSDGRSSVSTNVTIIILNVNDLAPVFRPDTYNTTVEENVDCDEDIAQVTAYDPDYPVEGGDIVYSLNLDQQTNFTIDEKTGVITLKGCMDREATNPFGVYGHYKVYPYAHDEGGNGLSAGAATVNILIQDVNDNHPYIQSPGKTIVIMENKSPDAVAPTTLQLDDVDSTAEGNGCPCTLAFDASTPSIIMDTFKVTNGTEPNRYLLWTIRELDREAHKYYNIPFRTTDNAGLSGIRYQRVEVGDENDSPMTDGQSKINVYNYKGSFPDTIIGSVYVTDADDYDTKDKVFQIDPATDAVTQEYFIVDYNGGNITMRRGTPEGNYTLVVQVKDNVRTEEATGTVYIVVVDLPQEAVLQSGSFLIDHVTTVKVMAQSDLDSYAGTSIYDNLRRSLADIYVTPMQNVDIFTLIDYVAFNSFGVKVRFNVHGSPYYLSSHLNGLLMQNKAKVEEEVGITIPVVDDNKCLYEGFKSCNRTSCQQELLASVNEPLLIAAPTSTMVGVSVTENYTCECGELFPPPKACPGNYCHNGGSCSIDTANNSLKCTCPDSYNYGPRCELLTARMKDGYAWYDELGACHDPTVRLTFQSDESSALLLYNGPLVAPPYAKYPRDFIYVILNNWRVEVYLDLGSATSSIALELEGDPSEVYEVIISWTVDTLRLEVPNCGMNTTYDQSACVKNIEIHSGDTSILNVGGPLQLGGLAPMVPLSELGNYYEWDISLPTVAYFSGCISLLQYNNQTYDLNSTSYSKNFYRTCSEITAPPTELVMSSESVFIIVGSLLLLLLLVLILLVLLRRRKKPDSYPDHLNEIVKETMGRTDIEGYGEKDMTQFDLKLLRVTPDGQLLNGHAGQKNLPDVARQKPVQKAPIARLSEGLSIGNFIEDNTKKVDKEHPDFDDVRHYCFEGDELSTGSLSSLGSGSSDDGNYNYLEDWGPRFKPLADLYRPEKDEEVDSDYEFPLPKKTDKKSSRAKASPTSPSVHSSSSSAGSSGANSVTQIHPSEAVSPSLPYTRLVPQRSHEDAISEGPRVLRGEYHEAVNPLDAYDTQGKESWC